MRQQKLPISTFPIISQWNHFSHYKLMEIISCHFNKSSYPIGTKNNIVRSPYL